MIDYKPKERQDLEELYRKQNVRINELEQENKVIKEEKEMLIKQNTLLQESNKKLNEFKTKREESMFYFKAQMERAEPINSKEAEELQKYKKLFEKLYREELHYLEEENKKLKERIKELEEKRIFSLGEYDYMILTSTTPQLKLIKKKYSDLCSNINDGLHRNRNRMNERNPKR